MADPAGPNPVQPYTQMQAAIGILLSLVLRVGCQQDFDVLPARIDTLLKRGERQVEVLLEPGTYLFRDGHLSLSGLEMPDLEIRLTGRDAVLVGADDGRGYRWENGYVDLDALQPVDIRRPVKRALFWPIPCLFRKGIYKLRCREADLTAEEARDVHIILSQWFFGAVYEVDRIRNGWLYFRKTERGQTRMLTELRFGRCLPRYILCLPPQRSDLHACMSSAFLNVEDSRIRSLSMEGITFLGNGAGAPLIGVRKVRADSIRVSGCRFEGIRSQVMEVSDSEHIRLINNLFHQCYLGAVRLAADTNDALVQGNRFLDNGIQMTNTPIVLCQGKDFLVRDNFFEDFAYSAIGVGLHFTDPAGCVTSGKVEENEICMSESFRSGVPRELIDGGAIYVWTQNRDVAICRNFIHDIDGPHGNRGIFADDGAVNVEISDNLLLNIAGGRGIDLRRALRVERKRNSSIRKVNLGNRMSGNVLDGRCRFFVRRGDPTSLRGENRQVPRGADRAEIISQWRGR